jgi:hypothetical protein
MQVERTFLLGVVGESFRNDDGSSRQALLAAATLSTDVVLVPEPDNRFDGEAVSVHLRGLGQVGYLPSGHDLSDDVAAGFVGARIASITGGTADKPSRGLVLEIQIFDEASAPAGAADVQNATEVMSKPMPSTGARPAATNRSILAALAMLAALVAGFGWVMQRVSAPATIAAPPRAAAAPEAAAPAAAVPRIPAPDTPAGRRPLTRDEIVELQQGLIRAGFAIGAADGVAGPRTRATLRSVELLAGWKQTELGPVAAHLEWIRAQKP